MCLTIVITVTPVVNCTRLPYACVNERRMCPATTMQSRYRTVCVFKHGIIPHTNVNHEKSSPNVTGVVTVLNRLERCS